MYGRDLPSFAALAQAVLAPEIPPGSYVPCRHELVDNGIPLPYRTPDNGNVVVRVRGLCSTVNHISKLILQPRSLGVGVCRDPYCL